jgi:hypothetical protein
VYQDRKENRALTLEVLPAVIFAGIYPESIVPFVKLQGIANVDWTREWFPATNVKLNYQLLSHPVYSVDSSVRSNDANEGVTYLTTSPTAAVILPISEVRVSFAQFELTY